MGIIRDNPIFRREGVPRRLRNASPNVWSVLAVLLAALSGFGGVYLARWNWESPDLLAAVIAWLWAVIALLVIPSHTSRAIIQERLQGSWEAVVLTRLRPAEIFFGKLFAVLIPIWLVGLLFLPSCLLLAASTPFHLQDGVMLRFVAAAYAAGTVGGLAVGAIGLLASMRCSSIWAAQLWAYLPIVIMVGALAASIVLHI